LSSSNFFNLQGIKIINISGNGITGKIVGLSFGIGDESLTNSMHYNTYIDPDLSDQNEDASPTTSSQL
jgi:hypothetical protein